MSKTQAHRARAAERALALMRELPDLVPAGGWAYWTRELSLGRSEGPSGDGNGQGRGARCGA
jgi:hypothetical protein